MKKAERKNGGVLVMAMVVMLAFSLLAIGLFKLYETDAVETVYVEQIDQAFWVAEAGLQRMVSKLRSDKTYRGSIGTDATNPSTESGSIGAGSYVAEAWGDGAGTFEVRSLATVRSAQRLLGVQVVLSDIGDSTLISLGEGGSSIRKDGTIVGSIYNAGELTVAKGTTVTGTVYADNYSDFDTGAAIPEDGLLDLSIDQSLFNSYLALPNSGIVADPLVLGGSTLVVGSSLGVQTIDGPGTIVVKGDQTFTSDLVIGDNVTIIVGGDLTIKRDAEFGNNVTLFATGTADLFKNALADVETGSGCVFLSLGDMDVRKEFEFDGLIFTEGTFTAHKDMTVTGTIITTEGFDLRKDATATFEEGMIPEAYRDSIIISTYIVQSSVWTELLVN